LSTAVGWAPRGRFETIWSQGPQFPLETELPNLWTRRTDTAAPPLPGGGKLQTLIIDLGG
jgi:hypothetical protein